MKLRDPKSIPATYFLASSTLGVVCAALHGITQKGIDPRSLDSAIGLGLALPVLSLFGAGMLFLVLGLVRQAKSHPRFAQLAIQLSSFAAAMVAVMGPIFVWIAMSDSAHVEDSIYLRVSLMPLVAVACGFGAFFAFLSTSLPLLGIGTLLAQGSRMALHASRMSGLEADSPELIERMEAPKAMVLRGVNDLVRRSWSRARKRLRYARHKAGFIALGVIAPFLAVVGVAAGLPGYVLGLSFVLSILFWFIGVILGPSWEPPLERMFLECLLLKLRETQPQLQAGKKGKLQLQLGPGPTIRVSSSKKGSLSFRIQCEDLPFRIRAFAPGDLGHEGPHDRILSGTEALDRAAVIQPGRKYRRPSLALSWLPPAMRSLLLALVAREAAIDDQGNLEVDVDLVDHDAHVLIDELLVLFEEFGATYTSLQDSDRVFETLDALSFEQERSALLDECAGLPKAESANLLQPWIEGGRGPSRLSAALLVDANEYDNLERIKDDEAEQLEIRGQALRAMCARQGGLDQLVNALRDGPWELALGVALALHRLPLESRGLPPQLAGLHRLSPHPNCTLPYAFLLVAPHWSWPDEAGRSERILSHLSVTDSAVHPACLALLDAIFHATEEQDIRAAAKQEITRLGKLLEARKLEGRGALSIEGGTEGGELALEKEAPSEGALSAPSTQGADAPDALG